MKRSSTGKKKVFLKKAAAALLACVLVIGITGCGSEEPVQEEGKEDVTVTEPKVAGTEEALAMACEKLGVARADITYYEVEHEVDDNLLCYDVTVVLGDREYELVFNEEDGSVVEGPEEESFDEAGMVLTVPAADAIQTALKHAGLSIEQVDLYKVMLDEEHGAPVYELEMKKDSEILKFEISAEDGTVLQQSTGIDR